MPVAKAQVLEVGRITMSASRRLQLAAEGKSTIGIALRRWRRQTEARGFRTADGNDDALADLGAIDSAVRSRRWATSLACRAHPRSRA